MFRRIELFSKRKRDQERSGQTDVYQYDSIPEPVVNQIFMIMDEAIGYYYVPPRGYHNRFTPDNSNGIWDGIIETIAREYGDPDLTGGNGREMCARFLKGVGEIEQQLDLIEVAFKAIDRFVRDLDYYTRQNRRISMKPDEAIDELNYRLREGGVGYQYEAEQMVRVDSEYVHQEVVKNALTLIHSEAFAGVEEEFLSAHQHYRVGEYKDAVVDAGAAFESTLKTICDRKEWKYDSKARASDLLNVVRAKGLYPEYLNKSFEQLLAVLKSGLPQVRNNEGSHGQGSTPKQVPNHIAAYALHLAAANIVFLVNCMKDHG